MRPATSATAARTATPKRSRQLPSIVVTRARQPGSYARQTPLSRFGPAPEPKADEPGPLSAQAHNTLATVRTAIRICPVT